MLTRRSKISLLGNNAENERLPIYYTNSPSDQSLNTMEAQMKTPDKKSPQAPSSNGNTPRSVKKKTMNVSGIKNVTSPYKSKKTSGKRFSCSVCLLLLIIPLMFGGCYSAYNERITLLEANSVLEERILRADDMLTSTRESLEDKEKAFSRVSMGYAELESQSNDNRQQLSAALEREDAYLQEDQRLRSFIQQEAKKDTLNKFGEGPYRVLFKLEFEEDLLARKKWMKENPDQPEDKLPEWELFGPHRIMLRLAHLDDMPHSVNTFLYNVELNLYNGVEFYASPSHVSVTRTKQNVLDKFEAAQKPRLAFPEYSDKMPHERYTIGFAGRPSGPDFYINLLDNTELHGPGGQKQYILNNNADPCFAKVIAGIDAVERLMKSEKLDPEKDDGILKSPVKIVASRILKPEEFPDNK